MSGPGSNLGQELVAAEIRRELPELGPLDSTSIVAGPAYFLSHTPGPWALEALGAPSTLAAR